MREIHIVDSTVRDGVQSLWGLRLKTAELLAVASKMDNAGYKAIEGMYGGIIFNYWARFLKEDPWEKFRLICEAITKTPLHVAIRSRNMLDFGPTPKPQALAKLWISRYIHYGIKRIGFLEDENDFGNLPELIKHTKEKGAETLAYLMYSPSPIHTDEYYAQKAREAVGMGIDILEIKDQGGLLTPERTRTLVPAIQKAVKKDTQIEFQSHCNTGLGLLCSLEAIKLGVDTIRSCLPPLAEGSSLPNTRSIINNAHYLGYSSKMNEQLLDEISAHFTYVAKKEKLPIGQPLEYDASCYEHQVPGGVMGTLKNQLVQLNAEDRFEDVLRETAQVRKDMGYPIMVTPASQFVVAQATINVLSGERYKEICREVIEKTLMPYTVHPPGEIDPVLMDKMNKLPLTQELLGSEYKMPSLSEMRKNLGEDLSDDEFLLRLVVPEEHIKIARAAGPIETKYPRNEKPFLTLLQELVQRKKRYIHIQKKDFSLKLSK